MYILLWHLQLCSGSCTIDADGFPVSTVSMCLFHCWYVPLVPVDTELMCCTARVVHCSRSALC